MYNIVASFLTNPWISSLAALLTLIPLLYLYLTRPQDVQLPGPKSQPWPLSIFAHYYAVKKAKGNHLFLNELYKKYGKIFKAVLLGRSPVICIGDPEMAKMIMTKNFDKFPNRGFPFEIPPPFDSELFLSKYPKWKRLRKVASPAFSAAKLKETLDSVEEAAARLNEKLMKYSQSGEQVEVTELFKLCVLDIILSSSFGVDTNDIQNGENTRIISQANHLFNRSLQIMLVSLLPFGQFLRKHIDIVGNAGIFMDLPRDIIRRRQQNETERRQDVAQLLIDANKTVVDGEPRLNTEEMRGLSLSFLSAGFDTTSTITICTIYFLATNQYVQEKLVQQIQNAEQNNQESTYSLVNSIDYLEWVLQEVMRLCPPGYRHLRECTDDCTINGVQFRKGAIINILAYSMHHDPEVWPEPYKFDPERFSPSEAAKRHPFSYLPFGGGPRQCIGKRYAMIVIKVLLVRMLDAGYRFEVSEETRPIDLVTFNMLNVNPPLFLKVIKHI